MGIQGLLRGLKPLLKSNNTSASHLKSNIRQFAQKTIAIDASSWLHKAGYSCAERLVESIKNNKEDSECVRIYTSYILKRCEELLVNANIKAIILVFDGKRCPLKAETNLERERKRENNIAEARRLKSKGMHLEANEKYRSCVKVTDTMAHNVAKAVRSKFGSAELKKGAKVQCIFSPYEADAQLAQLCFDRTADAVVTEDSDIILYSVACGMPFPIIYKLDRDTGSCDIISMTWLLSQKTNPDFENNFQTQICNKSKSVLAGILRFIAANERRKTGEGRRMFVQACILSGCDYSPSMPGIGLVTAFKMIKEFSSKNPDDRFQHVVRAVKGKIETKATKNKRLSSSSTQPPTIDFDFKTYEIRLSKSEAAFYYHLVWRVKDNSIDHLLGPEFRKNHTKQKHHDKEYPHCNLPSTIPFNNDLSFVGKQSSEGNIIEKNALFSRHELPSFQNHSFESHEKRKRKFDTVFSKKINSPNGIRNMRENSPGKKLKSIITGGSNIRDFYIHKEKKSPVSKRSSSSSSFSTNNVMNHNPFSEFSLHPNTILKKKQVSDTNDNKTNSGNEDEELSDLEHQTTGDNCKLRKQMLTKLDNVSLLDQQTDDETITLSISTKPSKFNKVESHYFSNNSQGCKSKAENRNVNSISSKAIAGKLNTLNQRNIKQSDICWSDGERDNLVIIEDPSSATPPIVNKNPKINNVNFVSPFARSKAWGRLKNKIPEKRKKEAKNTIMAGFHKQQMMSQNSSREASSCSKRFVSNEKKTTSIKKYFSPLPVRKMFD